MSEENISAEFPGDKMWPNSNQLLHSCCQVLLFLVADQHYERVTNGLGLQFALLLPVSPMAVFCMFQQKSRATEKSQACSAFVNYATLIHLCFYNEIKKVFQISSMSICLISVLKYG